MISGDDRHVAMPLAEAIGLPRRNVLTGGELSGMTKEALFARAARTDIFAEIDPNQKERIIAALRRRGHVVGYLGDGINDAPALHEADIGISVDGAVDVERDAADMILLQRDLGVALRGVGDGRATFANTMKYIAITTSANFGNMISMALPAGSSNRSAGRGLVRLRAAAGTDHDGSDRDHVGLSGGLRSYEAMVLRP